MDVFKKQYLESKEAQSLTMVSFKKNKQYKIPAWNDSTETPDRKFEIDTRELYLKLGAKYIKGTTETQRNSKTTLSRTTLSLSSAEIICLENFLKSFSNLSKSLSFIVFGCKQTVQIFPKKIFLNDQIC